VSAPPPAARGQLLAWLALAAGVILADQLSKAAVLQSMQPGDWTPVTPWFSLVLAFNRGAAFSFLDSGGAWQGYLFLGIALAASAVILRLLLRGGNRALFSLALALILGGALGNATDRLRYGHVVDFLDFHWGWLGPLFAGGHFPAFNLADSAITGGVIALLLDEVLHLKRRS
jgi:signal peptidase II